MSERPVAVGDLVLVRFEVTHRLNDGYLIMTSNGLSAITVHESDVATVEPEGSLAPNPPLLVAVG